MQIFTTDDTDDDFRRTAEGVERAEEKKRTRAESKEREHGAKRVKHPRCASLGPVPRRFCNTS